MSTIGIFYTVLAGLFIYRQFDWRRVYPMLLDTASLSGAILLIVGCATAMAWALTQSGFAQDLVKIMTAVPGGKTGFLLVSALAFVVLGSLLAQQPRTVYVEDDGYDSIHVRRCYARYASYDERTDTYMSYDGPRYCRL